MSKNRDGKTQEDTATAHTRISPSQFMRGLRPEYYSDTTDHVAYVLDASVFEYHLSSITQRNQTHDFEVFCRKLCERTICPHLRAQSGPEGGGDSKADTENFPVAEEIAAITYVGEPNSGSERWAFAFSAKEKWADKVRSDAKGIAQTNRGYNRIIFVTNQAARSKDRARIEDELTKEYGIPVTIHDRAWIMDQVIEHDRKDLAFNYLGVGEEKVDPFRLGPTDYSRLTQLTQIESQIDDPAAFEGMERQRATEALLAAKLSRGLERPRHETEGRFIRAMRLAEQHGTYRQQLAAQYESIWTAYWWYDDALMLNSAYTSFEALALKSDHAVNLELLVTLNQLLVNSVVHNLLGREECQLDSRTQTLEKALDNQIADLERPNNRLEAQASLLTLRLNRTMLDKDRPGLNDVFNGYGKLLDDVAGMGEFNLERVERMVEALGDIAGNEPAYNDLVEKLAKVVSERTSQAKGALILLKRAQKLEFKDHFDMIRLLGRAAIALTKKEHNESLVEALHLLMLAYRSAGLLWAARASCIFAASSIIIQAEEDDLPPVIFVPTMKVWAWIAFELRHIPEFLEAIQLLNGSLKALPLDDESKARVAEDIRELDIALGSVLLNLGEDELVRLSSLPDLLDGLGLIFARTALLYAMGHSQLLREDGSLPKEETDEEVRRMLSTLKSQPVGRGVRYRLILNEDDRPQTMNASIMGMRVEITFDGSEIQTRVAELTLGSIEAFFATVLESRVVPHTERITITIQSSADADPKFEIDDLRMRGTLHWPTGLSPASFADRSRVDKLILEMCGVVLAATCVFDDIANLLEKLFRDEAVQQRLAMIAASFASYQRLLGRGVTRLSTWDKVVRLSYDLNRPLPTLDLIDLEADSSDNDTDQTPTNSPPNGSSPPTAKSHREISIRSVIDVRAWDRAQWRGVAYPTYDGPVPPIMAFMFEDEEGGRIIFERWRERFGDVDSEEAIRISIVRHLPDLHPAHYCLLVSGKELSADETLRAGHLVMTANRSKVMEPADTVNLDSFMARLARYGFYYILPMVFDPSSETPKFLRDLAIRKKELIVREAAEVADNEMDSLALRRPPGT